MYYHKDKFNSGNADLRKQNVTEICCACSVLYPFKAYKLMCLRTSTRLCKRLLTYEHLKEPPSVAFTAVPPPHPSQKPHFPAGFFLLAQERGPLSSSMGKYFLFHCHTVSHCTDVTPSTPHPPPLGDRWIKIWTGAMSTFLWRKQ